MFNNEEKKIVYMGSVGYGTVCEVMFYRVAHGTFFPNNFTKHQIIENETLFKRRLNSTYSLINQNTCFHYKEKTTVAN